MSKATGGIILRTLIGGAALILLLLWWFDWRSAAQTVPPPNAQPAQTVTIDGTDSTGVRIETINVWNNYQTRSAVVARVRHGERVEMLGRSGDGVEIQTADGTRGWVTYWFIKELK